MGVIKGDTGNLGNGSYELTTLYGSLCLGSCCTTSRFVGLLPPIGNNNFLTLPYG